MPTLIARWISSLRQFNLTEQLGIFSVIDASAVGPAATVEVACSMIFSVLAVDSAPRGDSNGPMTSTPLPTILEANDGPPAEAPKLSGVSQKADHIVDMLSAASVSEAVT